MLRSTPVRLPPAQRPAPGGRRRNPGEPAERSRMRLLLLRSAVSRPVNEVAPLGVDTRFRGSFSQQDRARLWCPTWPSPSAAGSGPPFSLLDVGRITNLSGSFGFPSLKQT